MKLKVNTGLRELFRKAYKQTLTTNLEMGTSINIKTGNEEIDKILNTYKLIHSSIPYPLNKIEENDKYVTILNGVKSRIPKAELWVDNGLCAFISKDQAIRIKSDTYQIYEMKGKPKEKFPYSDVSDVLSKEFEWVSDRLKEQKSLKDFYKVFMKEEIKEAKKNYEPFDHKLMTMLTEERVRITQKPQDNKVVFDNNQYILDIFEDEYETGKTEEVVEIRDGKVSTKTEKEKEQYYNYDTYMKSGNEPMNKVHCDWMGAIFGEIVARIRDYGWLEYKALVFNGELYFEVADTIYKSSVLQWKEPEMVSQGIHLMGSNKNGVYGYQNFLDDGVTHEVIYRLRDLSIAQEKIYKAV